VMNGSMKEGRQPMVIHKEEEKRIRNVLLE
jgi:hypothetical protein